ncbi:hypothetical protein TPHA_0B01700 [Tetrapisispora phaffii CBS 4417]|uniref:Spore membrane assembly protein 2 n=1 Tax=Tetrapisispora phaffii (strain ATCC 24235 / CBS 4417 / NBRC 1672 / NRRL Y-8282 / UCD 70-5) TaxID=1071381 RepID=G8BPB2_TETPH|nr:hypothetical protein TPHA_0B01700 [Tetrapisispora phaffii CBS 4417]CCE61843.1 hypothetical protein TPHA_0B01700 [Tetrapisispora phaffii CBS 4417]
MFFIKRFIIWGLILGVSVTQILLYIPIFTCRSSGKNVLCSPIYKVQLIEDSKLTHDFIATLNELLRLLSYLTIDMGWDGEITTPTIYDNGYLDKAMKENNIFKVNYFGYCKFQDSKNDYCSRLTSSCLDLFGTIAKDMGVYLSRYTSNYKTNPDVIGSSLQQFYYLTLLSIYKFLKMDHKNDNNFLQILYGIHNVKVSDTIHVYSDSYKSAVITLYISMISNNVLKDLLLLEFTAVILLFLAISGFGALLFIWKKQTILPLIIMIISIISFMLSFFSFASTLTNILSLKRLERNEDIIENGWEMLQVTYGSGFIFACIRHSLQWVILILGIVVKKYYSVVPKPQPVIQNEIKEEEDK